MDLYIFSSDSLTNIWAGVGAHMWAVRQSDSETYRKGRITKASKVRLGSLGLFHCSEIGAKCLTTPFLFASTPDPDARIRHIWKGEFALPFRIHPLGSPWKRLPWREATKQLPIDNVAPSRVFIPYQIEASDWETILNRLGYDEGTR